MKVDFYATLRLVAREPGTEIGTVENVRHLIEELAGRYGDDFRKGLLTPEGDLSAGAIVLVNGVNVHALEGLDTRLGKNDVISMFPPIGGG